MALNVVWTAYGRAAGEALARAIAHAKGGDPLAPVTVVVPSNHVGVGARRLLASGALGSVASRGTGIAAVTFLTVYRLAELLGARRLAATERRPVSTPVIAAALRAALRSDAGAFADVANHPATETALVAAHRELRDLSPAALTGLSTQSRRASDVVRLHKAALASLQPRFYDEQDLTLAAIEVLEKTAFPEPVVVYLPQRISRHGGRLLQEISHHAPVTVVAGVTSSERADSEVRASLTRMGVPAEGAPAAEFSPTGTIFVTCSDADEEVRAAVRRVVEAARAGTSLDRIAILHASPDPYARLTHEHLRSAGIVANGAAVTPLSERIAGRTLLGLIDLPNTGFRRESVFAWLSGAPLLIDGKWAPVASWERLTRDAGVAAGRAQWDQRLTHLAEAFDTAAEEAEADPDAPEWRVERARTNALRARQLRSFVLGIADDLAAATAKPKRWSEHARWAKQLLDDLLGKAHRRTGWPAAEQKAAEKVEQALDRLGSLDEIEDLTTLDVFVRTLAIELESDLGRTGRLGEGVLVGSIGMGVGLDLDLVVVLGLAEGAFPTRVSEDSLIPDGEREACAGELPLRRALVDRQHRELLATLAGAASQVLIVPRGDLRRSSQRVPSRFAVEIASKIKGERWDSRHLLDCNEPWVEHIASFDGGLRRAGFPATIQEHRLKTSLANGSTPAEVQLGAEMVAARRGASFSRFDGNLAELAGDIPSPADRPTSPTRLEKWMSCPFAYLLENILGVEAVENPEDSLQISPADWGSVIHEVLERFILDVLARPESERPGPGDRWSPDDRQLLASLTDHVCTDYEQRGRTGRELFWRRDRTKILADLKRILDYDELHRARARTRPVAAELGFGIRGSAIEAVPVSLPDGRRVRFRGKADRVDLAEDGTIHVVDYKTGRTYGAEKLCEEDPDCGGTKLQLPVYGAAARMHQGQSDAPVHAEYWFVSDKGKWNRHGYGVTDEVLAHFGQTLGRIVEGIEAGLFAAHPSGDSSGWSRPCEFCDPDGLGVADLRRSWEHKRTDPLLASYADVVEPLAQ